MGMARLQIILSKGYKNQNQTRLRFSNNISNLVRWQLKPPYDLLFLVIGDYERKQAAKIETMPLSHTCVWSKAKETREKKRQHELWDTGDGEGKEGEGQQCSHRARHIPHTHLRTHFHMSAQPSLSETNTQTSKRLIGLQLLCLRSVFLYMSVSPVVLFTDTNVSRSRPTVI